MNEHPIFTAILRWDEQQGAYIGPAPEIVIGAAMEYHRTGGKFGTGAFLDQEFGESAQEIKERIYEAAQDLPPRAACAIALIEHRWLLEVKEQMEQKGVVILTQGMVRPRSLIMLGAELQAAEQAATH